MRTVNRSIWSLVFLALFLFGSAVVAQDSSGAKLDPERIPKGALIAFKGGAYTFSGFIGDLDGKAYLVTNICALSASRFNQVATLDGQQIELGPTALISQSRHLAMVPLAWDGPTLPVDLAGEIRELSKGDHISIIANSKNPDFAKAVNGQINRLPPDQIKVSTKVTFTANGSPIIHHVSGAVIAVASHFLDYRASSEWQKKHGLRSVSRSGVRLDGEIVWEEVSLEDLYKQSAAMALFRQKTERMLDISKRLMQTSKVYNHYQNHAQVSHLFDEMRRDYKWSEGNDSPHNRDILRRFVTNMINESREFTVQTEETFTLSFYRDQFAGVHSFQDDIRRNLESILKTKLSPKEMVPLAAAVNASQSPSALDTDALVIIKGESGAGTGFIAEIKGRPFLVTNIHVLGAVRDAEFKTVGGQTLQLGSEVFVSEARDVAVIPVSWSGPVLSVSESLEGDAVDLGNEVTVMGNARGANVATKIKGNIKGIGPDKLEVSAKFVAGNSGSPIIHTESGNVVAVASYLQDFRSKSKWNKGTASNGIRRFGYRLDGEISWLKCELEELHEQSDAYDRLEDRLFVMLHISNRLKYHSELVTSHRKHPSLGHLFKDISVGFAWDRGTSSGHNVQILRILFKRLEHESYKDELGAKDVLTIPYYNNQFDAIKGKHEVIRNNLTDFADKRL